MNFLKATALATLISLSANSFAAPALHKQFSDNELINVMKADGYSAVERVKDGIIKVKVDGKTYILINNDDGDLQAYYGFSGYNISYKDVNEWNSDKRLSRAYLDSDNDPVIEADLLANAGINEEHVTEFFDVFVQSVNAYRRFLLSHHQK